MATLTDSKAQGGAKLKYHTDFEEFHVTFEENTEGRRPHFYYNDKTAYLNGYEQTDENKNYKEDAEDKTKNLRPFDDLKKIAHTYADEFIKELNEADTAAIKAEQQKKLAEAQAAKLAEQEAVEKLVSDSAQAAHNGFKLSLKLRMLMFESEEADRADYEKEMKAKMPKSAKVKAELVPIVGADSKAAGGNKVVSISIELKDFKAQAAEALKILQKEKMRVASPLTTAQLNL